MSNGEKAILGGSLVVLIAMFLPWYGWDFNLGNSILGTTLNNSESVSGFHSWGWITFLGLLFVVALWVVRGPLSDQVELPELPLKDAQLFMIGGAVEVLGALLFWLAYKADSANLPGFSAGVRFGVFVALVGGIITIVGGYLKQSEPATMASTPNVPAPPPATYGAPPPPAAPPV
jgi:glucan phosphoethanolaminetransferase (alkaline phosphatase superfamily)